jgi:hypothetical protein
VPILRCTVADIVLDERDLREPIDVAAKMIGVFDVHQDYLSKVAGLGLDVNRVTTSNIK